MTTSRPDGNVESGTASELLDVQVFSLEGARCHLQLTFNALGADLQRQVSEKMHAKKGARLVLCHNASPLILGKTLREQGVAAGLSTLSCTYVATDLYSAWKCLRASPVSGEHAPLDGLSQIAGCMSVLNITQFPKTLLILTFDDAFNQSLNDVTLPSSLQSLTFGAAFDQNIQSIVWPTHLQNLNFWRNFQSHP